MKQTAVDFLFEELWDTPKDRLTWYSILEQAKQMEKEQIMDDFMAGQWAWKEHLDGKDKKDPAQYYNETFKSE